MKVFLGGTCAETTWRNELKPLLTIDYFDPVVKDWTPECQAEEERQKRICEFSLYVITPVMKGVFSIAEAVNDSIKRFKGETILHVLGYEYEWGKLQFKSLEAVTNLVGKNGGKIWPSCVFGPSYITSNKDRLQQVANYLNDKG